MKSRLITLKFIKAFPFSIWSWLSKIKRKEVFLTVFSTLIAAMFLYAGFIKLRNYEKTNWEMRNQVFPVGIADVLTWLIPIVELIIMVFLIYRPTRIFGFKASFGLLAIFTLYISLAFTNIFGRVPCSCGGILGELSYGWHIVFNILFMIIALFGIWIENEINLKSFGKRIKTSLINLKKGLLYMEKKKENNKSYKIDGHTCKN